MVRKNKDYGDFGRGEREGEKKKEEEEGEGREKWMNKCTNETTISTSVTAKYAEEIEPWKPEKIKHTMIKATAEK